MQIQPRKLHFPDTKMEIMDSFFPNVAMLLEVSWLDFWFQKWQARYEAVTSKLRAHLSLCCFVMLGLCQMHPQLPASGLLPTGDSGGRLEGCRDRQGLGSSCLLPASASNTTAMVFHGGSNGFSTRSGFLIEALPNYWRKIHWAPHRY